MLVGIAVDGEPVGGAIHQPFYGNITKGSSGQQLGRTIWGLTGLGVRGLQPRPPPMPTSQGLRVLTSRFHSTEVTERAVRALNPRETIRTGGSGHKVLLLLEGEGDAYVYTAVGTKKWDTCVGDGLIRQLGGQVTDLHGRLLTYQADPSNHVNKHGVVMTFGPPGTHEDVLRKIPEDVKELFPV